MTPIEFLDWTFLGGVFAVVFAVLSVAMWEQTQHSESTENSRDRFLLAERIFDGLVFLSLLVGTGALMTYCVLILADIPKLTWQGAPHSERRLTNSLHPANSGVALVSVDEIENRITASCCRHSTAR